jgi:hypothetical protein
VDDLSDFISGVLEFLVSGMLFTCSVLFLILGISGFPQLTFEELKLLAGSQLLVLVGLAWAYAMGVVAESLARAVFEVLLERVTVRRAEFASAGAAEGPDGSRRRSPRAWLSSLVVGPSYTPAQRSAAAQARERQRARVMTWHVALHAEVQGQLKRLRLERVFALSLFITAVSLGLRQEVGYAVAAFLATGVMVWLIHSRFKRFCDAIARAYLLVEDENLVQPAAGVADAAAASSGPGS